LKGAGKGVETPGLRRLDRAVCCKHTQLLPVDKLTVTFLLVPHFDKGSDNFTLSEDNERTCMFERLLKRHCEIGDSVFS